MKIKKKPMPILQKIFYIISFVFLIASFIYLGTKDFDAPKKHLTEQESFTEEFGITKDNLYVYKTAKDILETINTGSGIVFMGYPENIWSAKIAEILNDTAKKNGIKEIYYYNFRKDRSNNNHYYENIVKILTPYLHIIDTASMNLYAPTVLFVKNGTIIGYDDETSIVRGNVNVDNYWTKEKIEQKSLEYTNYFKKYLGVTT